MCVIHVPPVDAPMDKILPIRGGYVYFPIDTASYRYTGPPPWMAVEKHTFSTEIPEFLVPGALPFGNLWRRSSPPRHKSLLGNGGEGASRSRGEPPYALNSGEDFISILLDFLTPSCCCDISSLFRRPRMREFVPITVVSLKLESLLETVGSSVSL